MRQIELPLSPSFDFTQTETLVDQALREAGLRVNLKTTLRQFPGCIHWHVKRGKEKGTLEITMWPAQQRLWFSVHENRAGAWTDDALIGISSKITDSTASNTVDNQTL